MRFWYEKTSRYPSHRSNESSARTAPHSRGRVPGPDRGSTHLVLKPIILERLWRWIPFTFWTLTALNDTCIPRLMCILALGTHDSVRRSERNKPYSSSKRRRGISLSTLRRSRPTMVLSSRPGSPIMWCAKACSTGTITPAHQTRTVISNDSIGRYKKKCRKKDGASKMRETSLFSSTGITLSGRIFRFNAKHRQKCSK